MFTKVAILIAFSAVAYGGVIHSGHHSHHDFDHSSLHGTHGHGVSSQSITLDNSIQSHDLHHHDHHHHEHAHPRYEYKYSVSDPHTRDEKSHSESRDGDSVRGEYSLLQPDGSTRTVTYTANDHDGFQADVRTSGGNQHLHDHIHHLNDFHHHY